MVRAMSVRRRGDGDAGDAAFRELGHLGEVGAGHAHHAGVGAAGANLDPVVLKQLDGHVAVAEEADVVVELARGDGAGAGLFDLGGAGGADALIEVGGGDDDAVAVGFEQEVGEDGDGGFALDDALRGSELTQKILTADGDLHSRSLNGLFLFDSRHAGAPPNQLDSLYTRQGGILQGALESIHSRVMCPLEKRDVL